MSQPGALAASQWTVRFKELLGVHCSEDEQIMLGVPLPLSREEWG